MLVQDRLVLMWPTDINHTSERASVQLIEVASTISVSALNANEIALITGCAHLPRGGVDSGATFPHAIVATTLMSDERSSGGSEGWRKSGAGAESWGEATAAVSYAGLGRAVDTPGMRGWQALVAMAKAEGGSGKVLAGTVEGGTSWGTRRSDMTSIAWSCLAIGWMIELSASTSRIDSLLQLPCCQSLELPPTICLGGAPGYSDARRQGAWMVAITSPDALDVVRQERSRHDTCCDSQGMPISESPMMSAAPPSVSGDGSGGVPVGEVLSPDGAPMPHSHETHLSAAASLAGGPACWGVCFTDAIGIAFFGGRARMGVGLPCWHAGGAGAREHSSAGDQPARWCPHVTLPRNPPLCGGIATGSAECGGVCLTDAWDRRSHEAQGGGGQMSRLTGATRLSTSEQKRDGSRRDEADLVDQLADKHG